MRAAATIEGDDPEDLHDLRVSVRRLRAALRLYERQFPELAEGLEDARFALRDTARILGRARDLDVQLGRMREWLETSGRAGTPPARHAVQVLERERALARGPLMAHLRGPLFTERLVNVERTARSLVERGNGRARLARPAREPGELLRRPSKRVLQAAEAARATPLAAPRFHELRIQLKHLRYAIEFLAPLLPFPHRRLLERLRAAQASLGALQDAAVEQAMAEELVEGVRADAQARAVLSDFQSTRSRDVSRLLGECARMLKGLEPEVRRLRGRL